MRSALLRCVLVLAATGCGSSSSPVTGDDQPAADGGTDPEVDGGDTGPCTDGERRCGSAMEVETCSAESWTSVESCPLGCAAGACSTTTMCSSGARACFGDSVGVCNSTGTGWLYETSCAESCAAGACVGACIAGTKRCNANAVETCGSGGTWSVTEACTHSCDSNQCVLEQLNITTSTDLDGLVIVDGPVNVFAGATLRSPTGNLTIRATSITVDAGGSIEVVATNHGTEGRGGSAASCYGQGVSSYSTGGGGGHATRGTQGRTTGYTCGGSYGPAFGSAVDLSVAPGGPGGSPYGQPTVTAAGGGVLRLYAPTITISGALRADGVAGATTDGGSGAGGAILVAADKLVFTGSISAAGGGTSYGAGGDGFAKLVHGSAPTLTGTVRGTRSTSIAPPITISSLTHPSSELFYNDDFTTAALAWPAPYAARQGYYWRVDTTAIAPPTPGNSALATTESISVARDKFVTGDNYVHFVSIDSTTQVGTVESAFRVRVNSDAPPLTSATHPSQSAWSTNHDPLVAWTFPHGDASYKGAHYVLDHYGSTIPSTSATFIPVTQHQVLHAGLADGIWVVHVISVDHAGRRTRAASHYQMRIGANPGVGRVLGHVNGPSGAIGNATVSFNRGVLADQHTNSGGVYDLTTVPAGTWEVTASAPGLTSSTQTVIVPAAGQATLDFTLVP